MSPSASPNRPPSRFEAERNALVDSFLKPPGARVSDPRVIAAMRATPRHLFVPPDQQGEAYSDHPLPIGYGQTISQPSLVAFMTEQLRPEPGDRILEVGTGSGYQAAVLSPLVSEVYSVEIVEPLARRAAEIFAGLGYHNVHTRIGNGYEGWPDEAPFDAIIVTCAPDDIPPALVEQLREGGRLVIPVGPQAEPQELYLLEKRGVSLEKRAILRVRFVPMTGNNGP